MRHSVFLIGVFMCVAGSSVWAATDKDIRSKQNDLEKIQKELTRKKNEKRETVHKEKELSKEVERISQELKSSREALSHVESKLREAEKNRSSAEERLWASQLGIDQWRDLLIGEMKHYYELSLTEKDSRFIELAYRQAVIGDKVTGLGFALQQHAEVESLRNELVESEVAFQKLKLQRKKEAERVKAAQGKMRSLHKTVKGRRAVLEEDIKDLKQSAKKFENLIQKLIREQKEEEDKLIQKAKKSGWLKTGRLPVDKKRGKLPWPIEGEVVERFGRSRHPELDTYVFSNGIKLRPKSSGKVRCVDKGEVLYSGAFMGYGLMALVAHPNNLHSIYAHLGDLRISRGDKVSVGQVIGLPGKDTEARPLVYFELRVSGISVDPLVWLK